MCNVTIPHRSSVVRFMMFSQEANGPGRTTPCAHPEQASDFEIVDYPPSLL